MQGLLKALCAYGAAHSVALLHTFLAALVEPATLAGVAQILARTVALLRARGWPDTAMGGVPAVMSSVSGSWGSTMMDGACSCKGGMEEQAATLVRGSAASSAVHGGRAEEANVLAKHARCANSGE